MKIIDRYIFRQLLGPFIFAAGAFVSVASFGLCFSAFDLVGKYNAPWSYSLQLIALRLPMVIVPVIPMSMLLGTLLAFGKMSGNSEITAMKSGGMSFFRIMAPVIALGFIVSVISFSANQFLAPWANKQYNYIEKALIKKEADSNTHIRKDILIKGQINPVTKEYALLYAKQFDESSQQLDGVMAQTFNNGKLEKVISAKSASYIDNVWQLNNCSIYRLNTPNPFSNAAVFDLPIAKRPELVIADQQEPEELEFKRLFEIYMMLRKENSPDYRKFETEVFNRAAIPFAGVIFALVGAPLGMQSTRSSSSVGLGISLVVILLYYAIYSFMLTLGKGGVVNGFIAAWSPNIIGMLFGFYLIHKARKK